MTEGPAAAEFVVRAATAADAELLARHRGDMWRDLGRLPDALYPEVLRESAGWFAHAIPDGIYHGWLAAPAARPDEVVAGAGFLLRPIIPTIRPRGGVMETSTRPQALVVNVYTEPAWRRRGVARLLMEHVLEGARACEVSSVVLHASDLGRPLYESVGFRATNEMRYAGEL